MKPITILTILLMLGIQLNAQLTITGMVLDSTSMEAIPYVNIGIVALAKGTVSDNDGNYTIEANAKDDIVSFSSIGYETFSIRAAALKKESTIKLVSKGYEIEMIEVAAIRFAEEEVILGVKNKKRGRSIGFSNAQLGTEIGAAIEIKKPSYIKSANFVLNHAKGDSLLFRVNIYDLSTGTIGKNLLSKNILIEEQQRKGTITVPLEQYNIILEADVLLSLEWLRNYDEIGNKAITFDTKKSRKLRGVYVKASSNGTFEKLKYVKKVKPCFYLKAKQSKSE